MDITSIITAEVAQHFATHCTISVGLWILVVVAIFLDLWDGLYTAKSTHERIHSHKMRVTIDKVAEYWRLLLIGFCMDTLGVVFPQYTLPYISMLFSFALICVEGKSMFEHAQKRKSKAVEAKDIALKIISAMNEKDAAKVMSSIRDYYEKNKKGE